MIEREREKHLRRLGCVESRADVCLWPGAIATSEVFSREAVAYCEACTASLYITAGFANAPDARGPFCFRGRVCVVQLESMRDAEAGEMTKLAGDGAAGGTAAGAQGRYLKPLTQEAYERTLRLRVCASCFVLHLHTLALTSAYIAPRRDVGCSKVRFRAERLTLPPSRDSPQRMAGTGGADTLHMLSRPISYTGRRSHRCTH